MFCERKQKCFLRVSLDIFCSSLAGLRPYTAPRRPATLWRPARCIHPRPVPCHGTPSHDPPSAWRNPTSTAIGNVPPSVPFSSPSPWWFCWPTLLVSPTLTFFTIDQNRVLLQLNNSTQNDVLKSLCYSFWTILIREGLGEPHARFYACCVTRCLLVILLCISCNPMNPKKSNVRRWVCQTVPNKC